MRLFVVAIPAAFEHRSTYQVGVQLFYFDLIILFWKRHMISISRFGLEKYVRETPMQYQSTYVAEK